MGWKLVPEAAENAGGQQQLLGLQCSPCVERMHAGISAFSRKAAMWPVHPEIFGMEHLVWNCRCSASLQRRG